MKKENSQNHGLDGLKDDTDLKSAQSEQSSKSVIQTTATTKPFYNATIPGDWEEVKIKDVADVKGGFAFDSSKFKGQGKYQVIKMSNLYENTLDLDRSQSFLNDLSEQEKEYLLNNSDILITLTGTIGKRDYGYSYQVKEEKNLLLNQRVAKLTVLKADAKYIFYEIKTKRFLNQFFYSARGGTGNQANVGTQDLASIKIALPPLPEQKAIAHILSLMDSTINKNNLLVAKKQLQKKWLMQNLLTGKKRLKGFEKEKWKEIHIRDVSKEVSIKNREDKQLTVLSCTKYDGLVPSLEYFGRKIFADDVSTYKVVPKNHFAYATNHIEEGSIGYQEILDEALISPMYTVFKTDSSVDDFYFYKLLKSHNLIFQYNARMEGSIDRRGGLRWDAFSIIKIHLPSKEEQTEIAIVLQAADKEIQLLKTKTGKLREQKKGMMQVLLTGKKRLKI